MRAILRSMFGVLTPKGHTISCLPRSHTLQTVETASDASWFVASMLSTCAIDVLLGSVSAEAWTAIRTSQHYHRSGSLSVTQGIVHSECGDGPAAAPSPAP